MKLILLLTSRLSLMSIAKLNRQTTSFKQISLAHSDFYKHLEITGTVLKKKKNDATKIFVFFMFPLMKYMGRSVTAVLLLKKHLTHQTLLMRHQKLLQTI